MQSGSTRSTRLDGRRRRAGVWACGLAVWFQAHGAWAQRLEESVPLQGALEWVDGSMSPLRWRDDDPDLIRAGVVASPEATLAEGARIVASASVDLDEDGRDERVLQIAPRDDPSPENTFAGVVLVWRVDGGWRAQVLARNAPWYDREYGSWETRRPSSPYAWSVVRDGRRRRLVIAYTDSVMGENPDGHGHGTWRHDALVRLRLVDGEVRADGFCTRNAYPRAGEHRWRSLHLGCFGSEGAPLPLSMCPWSSTQRPWGDGVDARPDPAVAPWCVAFARGPREPL